MKSPVSVRRALGCGAALVSLALSLSSARADLVAHYPMDEDFGDEGPAADAAGSNPGIPINGFGITRGDDAAKPVLGTAYTFDGASGLNLGMERDHFTQA